MKEMEDRRKAAQLDFSEEDSIVMDEEEMIKADKQMETGLLTD